MSYILDALKKSESERLKRDSPRFADLPSGGRSRQAPRWPWVLALLLAVNAALLLAYFYRDEAPAAAERRAVEVPAREQPVDGTERDEPPPAVPPAPAEPEVAGAAVASVTPGPESSTAARVAAQAPETAEAAPVAPAPDEAAPPSPTATYMELVANGRLSLPALHLDIHVYSGTPAERFVFVNMQKYRENDRLAEGPLVREIRPEGVVLEHRGSAFLLPRE